MLKNRKAFSSSVLLTALTLLLAFPPTSFAAYDWIETQPVGDTDKDWYSAASDIDGSNLIAGVDFGRLYISTNSGTSWTETQPAGDVDKGWRAVASDADGSTLIAGVFSGRLYVSTTSAATWTEVQPAGAANKLWQDLASDADGSNLIAAVGNGRLYLSTTTGATWAETQPAGNINVGWRDVASNDDGSKLLAINALGGVYLSTDGGTGWIDIAPDPLTWKSTTVSSDFQHIALIHGDCGDDVVFVSSDGGSNWTSESVFGGAVCWAFLSGDSTGTHMMVSGDPGRLYVSDDGGDTWEETQPADDAGYSWYGLASNADGSQLVAGANAGRIYLGTFFIPDTTAPTITIIGDNPTEVTQGTTYTDAGATAEDDTDGDLTVDINVTNSVDTATIGTYTVVYDVTDAADNTAHATRTVNVIEEESSGGSASRRRTDDPSTEGNDSTSTSTPQDLTDTQALIRELQLKLIELLQQWVALLMEGR